MSNGNAYQNIVPKGQAPETARRNKTQNKLPRLRTWGVIEPTPVFLGGRRNPLRQGRRCVCVCVTRQLTEEAVPAV